MPTTKTLMDLLAKAAPITWPSLSDLASSIYGRARGLDTLGREVRRLRVQTRKIGRELRVEPRGAVRVLEARGVTVEQATAVVVRTVEARKQEVPAMAQQKDERTVPRTAPAQGYQNPVVAAASQRYELLHRPRFVLPHGHADFGTDDLVRAVTGG
ncbi:MAG: hypothetical protein ACRDGT_10800 [Candidatus Limnocylindria bacterium]